MIISLIGMPGAGKTLVGKELSSLLGFGFVDTDALIEERTGLPLQDIIDREGEDAFLRIEEEAILSLSAREDTVIATGGSAVYSENAMRHLQKISTVVFLDAPFDTVVKYTPNKATRGIVRRGAATMEELYEQRRPLYLKYAELTVPVTEKDDVKEVAKTIARRLFGDSLNGRLA